MEKLSFRRLLFNLMTSGIPTDEPLQIRRLMLLNAFLMIGIFAFSFFALLNMLEAERYVIAALDFGGAALFSFGFADLRYTRKESRARAIGATALVLFMVLFMPYNQNHDFGLIWTIFPPIFLISLYGHERGLRWSLLYYGVLFTLGIWGLFRWENPDWNLIALMRFIVASLVLLLVVYVTEYAFERMQRNLERLSIIDPLTGLYNRRKIDTLLSQALEESLRHNAPFSLCILDIDNFKQINDTFGHVVGDRVLQQLSALLQNELRTLDTVGRWGGEEFIIIMRRCGTKEALMVLERLRAHIETYPFESALKVTCSFGLHGVMQGSGDKQQLISCADRALYSAKSEGKNRVALYAPAA
ncbi:MAG: GGDEF domain-containing protein [Campylobacterales bacterium]|nr:GGDEF domain-containing protein [Campylobacterales bacterium]